MTSQEFVESIASRLRYRPVIGAGKLDSIQVMRALAACAVCLSHVFNKVRLFDPSKQIRELSALPWTIGVDLFFVISGFIMMHMTRGVFGQRGATADFIKRRLVRIVPPYWFFTTLMVIATLVFPAQLNVGVFEPVHVVLSYLFIPHFNPGQEGLLQPILGLGWTLVYEMFFYMVFAACLLAPEKKGLVLLAAIFLTLFVTAKLQVWNTVLNTFWGDSVILDFLLGVYIAKLFASEKLKVSHIAVLNAVLLIALRLAFSTGVFYEERFFWGGIPALMLFSVLFFVPIGGGYVGRALVLLGDASYTLYLSHPFILVIVRQVFSFFHILKNEWGFIAGYCVAAFSVSVVSAAVFYPVVEKPVTKFLLGKVFPRPY